MENKKNQLSYSLNPNMKKHKNIVLYQNIGGHKADPLPYSRKNRVGGTTSYLIIFIMLNS